MDQITRPTDLSTCDKEPIHIPGSIQPHGVLLVIDPAKRIVQQLAGDPRTFLARETADILGQPIDNVLGAEATESLSSLEPDMAEPLYLGSIAAPNAAGEMLDLTAHYSDDALVLELEPASVHPKSAPQLLGSIRKVIATWEATEDLQTLLAAASDEFRRLTGFDRVMIYRFLEDETGVVVSEAKVERLDALLNHHYPASDIPKQARALYLRNPIRVIPDAGYTPAPLVPALNPSSGRTLDMSESVLRSVSPIHVQYLKNMDVAASMSISIVIDGALWGLVSCHHTSARHVHYELRETCKLLGQSLGQLIKGRLEVQTALQIKHLTLARDGLLEKLAAFGFIEESFQEYLEEVQRLLPADGVAFLVRGKLTQRGSTPSEGQTRELIEWLVGSSLPSTFATDSLSAHHAPAEAYASKASGLLASVISYKGPFVVVWFRAEYIETINWAGNPHKAAEPGAEPGQLSPRTSFAEWKETVRNRSRPWSVVEVESARTFGRLVIEMRMQDAVQGLNRQLQQTLSDKESLLAKTVSLKEEAQSQVQVLHKKEVELRTILENTSDIYIRMDEAGVVTAWNQKAVDVLQWSRAEAIGRPLEELIIPAGMREAYRNDMQQFLSIGQSDAVGSILEVPVTRKDGVLITVELRATAIRIDGRTIFTAFLQDITQRKLQEQQRLQDAQEDALTGLANRRAMYSFLKDRLKAKPTQLEPLQLLYLDLDNFKPINDSLGHAAGDRVLVKIADRLKECMRDEDLIARIGGDEFVIIATGLHSRDLVEKLCERLLGSLRKPVVIDKHEVSVGCSIGIVSAPKDSSQADDLLRFADIALYEAKAAGRNTWQFYTERMSSRLLVRRQLETDLRFALRRNELRLEFQPRYEVHSGKLIGAEALVRWEHPLLGLLTPERFISVAEEVGLIVPLSDWVLLQACHEATKWKSDVGVSVNLSPVEFRDGELVRRIRAALDESGLSPERLELEITESVMLDDTNNALEVMVALKALGVRLAMDDFGTGYSSLSYIHAYPFDGIKIDRSFIAALDGSASGQAVIEAVIGMGKALNLTITAEGVETGEQLDILARLNCNQAQGYYLGRPMLASSVNALSDPAE